MLRRGSAAPSADKWRRGSAAPSADTWHPAGQAAGPRC